MMCNYRSTPQIISAANSLIEHNRNRIKKRLLPSHLPGPKPIYHHAMTAEDEAGWIAQRVKGLLAGGVRARDIALLYRANYITRTLEEVFIKKEVPYLIYSGVQFFERMEVKDALSYLRLVLYRDDLSFMRVANVPKRNLGMRRMTYLREYAAEHDCSLYTALTASLDDELFKNTKAKKLVDLVERFGARAPSAKSASELLGELLDESGYEAMLRTEGSQTRLDNLAELKQSVYDYETSCGEESTPQDYLAHVALFTNLDAVSEREAVKLMTVHTAKGLEFEHVFICSLNEGVFPSRKVSTLEGMEEERRLAFVAMTRAKEGLSLSDAQGRNLDGSYRYPSRFIFNIDKDLLEYTGELDEALIYDAAQYIQGAQSRLEAASAPPPFAVGQRVVHPVLGGGQVTGFDSEKSAYVIKFDDLPTPRKTNGPGTCPRAVLACCFNQSSSVKYWSPKPYFSST
jgi:DNA helicase-2/ATP-dependent DNA helicase PcrA